MIFTGKNRKPIAPPLPKIPLSNASLVPLVRGNLKYNMFDAVKPTNCGYCGSNK